MRKPAVPFRGIYWATHYFNPYEEWPLPRIKEELERLADQGGNFLMTWFAKRQYHDIFDRKKRAAKEVAKWNRLKKMHAMAVDLGFGTGMVQCVNTLYRGQASDRSSCLANPPDWPGPLKDMGKLACPSTARGRKLSIQNNTNLLQDMPSVDVVALFGFDEGGCHCKRCTPWAKNFFFLAKDITQAFRKTHPSAKVYLADWGMSANDLDIWESLLASKSVDSSWLTGICSFYRGKMLEKRFRKYGIKVGIMPENTMIGGWGAWGANPLPKLVHERMQCAKSGNIDFLAPYSEGLHDEINEAVCLAMADNPNQPVERILQAYAGEQLKIGRESGRKAFARLALSMETAYLKYAEPGLWVSGIRPGRWPERDTRDGLRRTMVEAVDLLDRVTRCVPASVRKKHWWRTLAIQVELYALYSHLRTPDEVNQDIRRIAGTAHMEFQCGRRIPALRKELGQKFTMLKERHRKMKRMLELFDELIYDVYQTPRYEFTSALVDRLKAALKDETPMMEILEQFKSADPEREATLINALRKRCLLSDVDN